MGKETKIGLVVIGVLLVAFAALLFRRLSGFQGVSSPHGQTAAAPSEPPSSAGMSDKPAVILAQKDAGEPSAAGRGFWNNTPRDNQSASEASAEAPAGNFMPPENAPGEPATEDRYAPQVEPAVPNADAGAAAGPGNPFVGRATSPPADVTPRADDDVPQPLGTAPDEGQALAIPTQEPAASQSRNPLRRLSAQEPINDPQAVSEAPRLANEGPAPGERPSEDIDTADSEAPAAQPPLGQEDEPAQPLKRRPARAVEVDDAATPTQWAPGASEPSTAGQESPPTVTNGQYTVQPNDNLWVISEKVYGTGGYFKALYEHNRSRLPRSDRLVAGTTIAVPPVATLEQNYPALCPRQRKSALVKPRTMPASTRGRRAAGGNVYVVEEGDTLFDIARYELGKASRWAEIYELNRELLGEDFDYLTPGTELSMPPRASSDAFTRQGDSLQR